MVQRKSKDNDVSGAESDGSGEGGSSEVKMKSTMVTGGKVFTPSIDHIDLTELGRHHTKLSKLECSRFGVQISRDGS